MSTPNRPKRPRDPVELAHEVFLEAIGEKPKAFDPTAEPEPAQADQEPPPPEPEKDPAAVSLGRRGGLKGGPARAAKLTKEQMSEIGKKAAKARWGNRIE